MTQVVKLFNSGLPSSLLFFVLALSLNSCKKKYKNESKSTLILTEKKLDSIAFSVKLPPKKSTGFNMVNKYIHFDHVSFKNKDSTNKVVVKRVPRIYDDQIIYFGGGRIIDGKIIRYNHHYLITKNTVKLNFQYDNGNVLLMNSNSNVIIVDSLFQGYKKLRVKIYKSNNKENFKIELDNLYQFYKKKYLKKKLISKLNIYHYMDNLQKIHPLSNEIDAFLKAEKSYIIGDPLSNLLYFYAKNRINSFNYKELNTKYYSKEYTELVSIGVFNFLRHEDNKGNKQYKEALNWLKTTDLYKKNSIYIKKEITPLNNIGFKNKLKRLVLLDTSFNKTSFSKMLKKDPSDYYLIDFWATWCIPCIKGINSMEKMEFPKNVKVISLSLDKLKVKDKWKSKTKELGQTISFLVNDKNQKNKEFLKFIELQSVPRYILIDKNMNLIDEAFLHPNELQFLSKLKDVKNHKYW